MAYLGVYITHRYDYVNLIDITQYFCKAAVNFFLNFNVLYISANFNIFLVLVHSLTEIILSECVFHSMRAPGADLGKRNPTPFFLL